MNLSNQHTAFVGSIPENYDRYLGPCLFEPYAVDIAERVKVREDGVVLEIACGTGIATRHLRNKLPRSVRLIATDLNEAMLSYASSKFADDQAIEWKQADAAALPFDDESFDAVACQFGLMFIPDKLTALREVIRVLVPNGLFVFSVWDAIDKNDLPRIGNQAVSRFFEKDPPTFYEVPFGMHDQNLVRDLLRDAGFRDAQKYEVAKNGESPSAKEAARGLIEGNPIIVEINQRATSDLQTVETAVAKAIASKCGDKPVRGKLSAFVWMVRK
jgi:ubiquinone/menaquinone biosynthesis C-methylase UbiE